MKEIAIDVLKDGTIRFIRSDEQTNERVLQIVSELAPAKRDEVKRFLDGSKQIEIVIGTESLCG